VGFLDLPKLFSTDIFFVQVNASKVESSVCLTKIRDAPRVLANRLNANFYRVSVWLKQRKCGGQTVIIRDAAIHFAAESRTDALKS
jgi:hypothetical protein